MNGDFQLFKIAGRSQQLYLIGFWCRHIGYAAMKRDSDEKELYVPVDHFMVAGKNLYEIAEEFHDLSFYSLISVYEYPDL
jgi:hypothetical protein